MPIEKGYTTWARQTIESDIFYWKPDKWFKIWFYIIQRANYADNKQFKRGSCFITYKEIMDSTKATRGAVDSFVRWAKEQQMLTTKKTTRGMILFVLNYNKYQSWDNYENDTQHDSHTKHTRNTHDTINKTNKTNKEYIYHLADGINFWNSHLKWSFGGNPRNKTVLNYLLPKCKVETEHLKAAWNKINPSMEEWKHALKEYILDIANRANTNKDTFFEHRFTMYEFVKQSNGYQKFVNK